jgi:hypothetical protein
MKIKSFVDFLQEITMVIKNKIITNTFFMTGTLDIFKIGDMIDQNVGHRVFLEIQRMGSEQIVKITGYIRSQFSNEITPVCVIQTAEKTEEVFIDELRKGEIIS